MRGIAGEMHKSSFKKKKRQKTNHILKKETPQKIHQRKFKEIKKAEENTQPNERHHRTDASEKLEKKLRRQKTTHMLIRGTTGQMYQSSFKEIKEGEDNSHANKSHHRTDTSEQLQRNQ